MKSLKDRDFKERLLSIDDTAICLGLSPWTIRAWLRDGKLNSHKIGKRRLIPASEVARLLEQTFKPASKELAFA